MRFYEKVDSDSLPKIIKKFVEWDNKRIFIIEGFSCEAEWQKGELSRMITMRSPRSKEYPDSSIAMALKSSFLNTRKVVVLRYGF